MRRNYKEHQQTTWQDVSQRAILQPNVLWNGENRAYIDY